MQQPLKNKSPLRRAAFSPGSDIVYPADYISPEPVSQYVSQESSNIISLRPYLKEGKYNHLISYFQQNRPCDGSPIFLSVGAINKAVSHQVGLNRTTIIRQLERLVVESLLPEGEQNPFIRVKAFGEKKKGTTSNRGFIISFKGSKPKEHVTRFFNLDVEVDEDYRHALTAKQILAAYEHEAQRLEEGHKLKRLRGKDLACRLGVCLRTIRRLRKALMAQGFLKQEVIEEEFKYTHYNYEKGKRVSRKYTEIKKRFRVVYAPTKIHSQNSFVQNVTPYLKPCKIEDFTIGSLKRGQVPEDEKRSFRALSQDFLKFQNAWDAYVKIFTPKEGESLRQSLAAAKKFGIPLPTPERLMEALERSKAIPYLKLARRVGFIEAEKAELLAKGATLNDSSVHWKKDIQGKHSRLGFLWILKHAEGILQGKYDRKELSDKAKGRVWGETDHHPAQNTPAKRTEVPGEWFKGYLKETERQKDLRALLIGLWKKCGWSTYETLIDPCEIVKNEEGRWVFMPPNRFQAKLLEEKLKLHWWRVVLPTTNKPARAKLREAYDAWLKENPEAVKIEEEKAEHDREEQPTEKGDDMGFVPANDDEGVVPHWSERERSTTKASKDHRSRRTQSEDIADHGRESEEEILRERKERQESLLHDLSACTNLHASEKALRKDTIKRYGINAYNRWFNRCRIEISEGTAKYVAPNDFIAVEIERRYGVVLNEH